MFNSSYKKKIYELSQKKAASISDTIEDLHRAIFRQHPLQEPSKTKIVNEVLNNDLIKLILNS